MTSAEVVWTTAARKRVHPRRQPGAGEAARPRLSAEDAARAVGRWALDEKARRAWRTSALRSNEPECIDLVRRAITSFERPQPEGRLDHALEATRAIIVGATLARPFSPLAEAVVAYWMARAGAAFAVETLVRSWRYTRPGKQTAVSLSRGEGRRPAYSQEPDKMGLWTALRCVLASTPAAEYEPARDVAASLREEVTALYDETSAIVARCALAYLFPSERSWAAQDADALLRHPFRYTGTGDYHPCCLLASLEDPDRAMRLAQLPRVACGRIQEFAETMVDLLGLRAFSPLAAVSELWPVADRTRGCARAMALLRSNEVATWFAARLEARYIGPVAAAYLAEVPSLSIAALAGLEKPSKTAAALLETLAAKHPGEAAGAGAALPPNAAGVLERVQRRAEQPPAWEEATPDEVPVELRASDGLAHRRMPTFWEPSLLPRLVLENGKALPVSVVEALGPALARCTVRTLDDRVAALCTHCTERSLFAFGWAVFEAWLRDGAPPKEKWALLALAHTGGDEAARRLGPLMLEWPSQGASARAALGLDVLGHIGTDNALFYLRQVSRKAKTQGLRGGAAEAIAAIAAARDISVDDIADRLVPTLDLGVDGRRELDYGGRRFTVGIDANLKPFLEDESGARLARLPSARDSDDRGRVEQAQWDWKGLRADAQMILKEQLERLEEAMCRRRAWSPTSLDFLRAHPLLRLLVRRLVWQARDGEGRCLGRFRVTEDSTFADAHDEPFCAPAATSFVLPHPLEIPADELAAWRRVLADYQIVQPFEQVHRAFHAIAPDECSSSTLTRFTGQPVSQHRVFALKHRGWSGGGEGGGGVYRRLPDTRFAVHASIDGGTLGEVKLTEWTEQSLSGEAEPEPARFGQLAPVVFSEVVRDLQYLRG